MPYQKRTELKNKASAFESLNNLTRLLRTNPGTIVKSFIKKKISREKAMKISHELKSITELPPQIAFIGKTGVGKSSTINKLFNPKPNLKVDHVQPATMGIEIFELSLGERGKLIVVDCPGLGESKEADKRNISAYKQLLEKSDVAVWILKADDKTIGIDQGFMKKVLPKRLRNKLVIAINQVDLMHPGNWYNNHKIPSIEQEENIIKKEEYVRKKFTEAGLPPFRLVSFSANKKYHLAVLFNAMVDACPSERIPSLVKSGDQNSYVSRKLRLGDVKKIKKIRQK